MLKQALSLAARGQLFLPPAKETHQEMRNKSLQYIQLSFNSQELAILVTDGELLLTSEGIPTDDLFQLGETLATSFDLDYYSLRIDDDDLDKHSLSLGDLMDEGNTLDGYKLARTAIRVFNSYFRKEHECTAKQLSHSTAKDWSLDQAHELAFHLNRQPDVLMTKIFWRGDLEAELKKYGYSSSDENQAIAFDAIESLVGCKEGTFEKAIISSAIEGSEYQLKST